MVRLWISWFNYKKHVLLFVVKPRLIFVRGNLEEETLTAAPLRFNTFRQAVNITLIWCSDLIFCPAD